MPANVTIRGGLVRLDVHGEVDAAGQLVLERLCSDGDDLDRRCRATLLDPNLTWGDGSCGEGATELYVRHHLSELDELAARLGIDYPQNPDAAAIERFLAAMSVRSIWATPDSDSSFLHVDYSIDPDLTQYVLSVALDRNGIIRSVRMES